MSISEIDTAPLLLRKARLLQMLDALQRAGGTPISSEGLHAFAFLANVLSPLWDLSPLDGSVLKSDDGPYYPPLQRGLDALVGDRLVSVFSLRSAGPKKNGGGLVAEFTLNQGLAAPILDFINGFPDEKDTPRFLLELANAFVEIAVQRRDDAARLDAAYSDPAVASDRVVDFAEWVMPTSENPSWNVAESFQRYVPTETTLNRAEKLLMYMRLLKRRAHG